ncbi:uncharacterized protein PG986_001870 [Apiospora aurea]|uniref:Uncharacterized protein n=1 Tax=Apiospora aurea TaxID=335848 RepID=A0ABR1QYT7_9PEZI
MPRPSLHLTLPTAIARRQHVLNEATRFFLTLGATSEQIQERLPLYVTAAEDHILQWASSAPDTDKLGRLARGGCLSSEYVTWLVDRALWSMIFSQSHFTEEQYMEAFMNVAPEPEESECPFDEWLPLALKVMTEENAEDASRNANVKTEVQVASSSRPVGAAPAPSSAPVPEPAPEPAPAPAPAPAPTPAPMNVTSPPSGKQAVVQETASDTMSPDDPGSRILDIVDHPAKLICRADDE